MIKTINYKMMVYSSDDKDFIYNLLFTKTTEYIPRGLATKRARLEVASVHRILSTSCSSFNVCLIM